MFILELNMLLFVDVVNKNLHVSITKSMQDLNVITSSLIIHILCTGLWHTSDV